MPDKTHPPAHEAASDLHAPKAPAITRKPGFDPAALKGGGKVTGGKGPAPGKRIALPGKARGR